MPGDIGKVRFRVYTLTTEVIRHCAENVMITANDIRQLRTDAPDYLETQAIKTQLAIKRQNNQSFYLSPDDFNHIVRWKLGRQIRRTNHLLIQNAPHVIEATTRLALSVQIDKPENEFQFRFATLTALKGVGTGVASAILALSFPEKYCVIDYRGWYQVFRKHKTVFSFGDYRKYLKRVLKLAEQLGWSPQEVDLAIWEFDRRTRNKQTQRHPK